MPKILESFFKKSQKIEKFLDPKIFLGVENFKHLLIPINLILNPNPNSRLNESQFKISA